MDTRYDKCKYIDDMYIRYTYTNAWVTSPTTEVSCDFTEESFVFQFLCQAIPPKPKGLMGKLTVGILTAAWLERLLSTHSSHQTQQVGKPHA